MRSDCQSKNNNLSVADELTYNSPQNVHLLDLKVTMTLKSSCRYRSSCQEDAVEWLLSKFALYWQLHHSLIICRCFVYPLDTLKL